MGYNFGAGLAGAGSGALAGAAAGFSVPVIGPVIGGLMGALGGITGDDPGYTKPPDWVIAELKKSRNLAIGDVRRAGVTSRARAGQNMVSRGLSNTTVPNQANSAIDADINRQIQRINAQYEQALMGFAKPMAPDDTMAKMMGGLGQATGQYFAAKQAATERQKDRDWMTDLFKGSPTMTATPAAKVGWNPALLTTH